MSRSVTTEELIVFKKLKDSNDDRALQIWDSFLTNKDEVHFHKNIVHFLSTRNNGNGGSNSARRVDVSSLLHSPQRGQQHQQPNEMLLQLQQKEQMILMEQQRQQQQRQGFMHAGFPPPQFGPVGMSNMNIMQQQQQQQQLQQQQQQQQAHGNPGNPMGQSLLRSLHGSGPNMFMSGPDMNLNRSGMNSNGMSMSMSGPDMNLNRSGMNSNGMSMSMSGSNVGMSMGTGMNSNGMSMSMSGPPLHFDSLAMPSNPMIHRGSAPPLPVHMPFGDGAIGSRLNIGGGLGLAGSFSDAAAAANALTFEQMQQLQQQSFRADSQHSAGLFPPSVGLPQGVSGILGSSSSALSTDGLNLSNLLNSFSNANTTAGGCGTLDIGDMSVSLQHLQQEQQQRQEQSGDVVVGRSERAESNLSLDADKKVDRGAAKVLFRTTRNQPGKLVVTMGRASRGRDGDSTQVVDRDGTSVRPACNMTVSWQVNSSDVPDFYDGEYVIGLVRYGSPFNSPCIITKLVDISRDNARKTERKAGSKIIHAGRVYFYAPKSAGLFVYRLFDQSTKEKCHATLGTSVSFQVNLTDIDVTAIVKQCAESLADKSTVLKGVSQLCSSIKCLRNSGKPINGDSAQHFMTAAVASIVKLVRETTHELDSLRTNDSGKIRSDSEIDGGPAAPGAPPANGGDAAAEEEVEEARQRKAQAWSSIKQMSRLHMEAHDTLQALMQNGVALNMIPPDARQAVTQLEDLFCTLLNRYFVSHESRDLYRQSLFGFTPLNITGGHTVDADALAVLDATIKRVLPSLLPSKDFKELRAAVRARIEALLQQSGIIHPESTVAMYGSSCNNFGNDSADLDMCMVFPPTVTISAAEQSAIIEKIAEKLVSIGMLDVSSRATARIPIVNFKDPESGLDCDIAFNNPLAIWNTKLLKTYSEIDGRVLELAFIIKHWAKQRHINSPGEGTLSSYGYIICLIHFLQNRPTPLLPNLQRLPPEWDGRDLTNNDLYLLSINGSGSGSGGAMSRMEPHPSDIGSFCNTYFYSPYSSDGKADEMSRLKEREKMFSLLSAYAKKNTETTGELLLHFFKYFSWDFDYKHLIISIQSRIKPEANLKITKAELDGWSQHERLSIEDPFEHWYDVAHVVKGPQMSFMRGAFLSALTSIVSASRARKGTRLVDGAVVACAEEESDRATLIAGIFAEGEAPPFRKSAAEELRTVEEEAQEAVA